MKNLGYTFAGLGGLIVLVSFVTDTAPEGTHNIGLMQQQMMFFSLGALLSLVGAFTGAIGYALSRMEDAGLLPPPGMRAKSIGTGGGSTGVKR